MGLEIPISRLYRYQSVVLFRQEIDHVSDQSLSFVKRGERHFQLHAADQVQRSFAAFDNLSFEALGVDLSKQSFLVGEIPVDNGINSSHRNLFLPNVLRI